MSATEISPQRGTRATAPNDQPVSRRGTSNGNAAGSSEDRRRRKAWLVETYRADVDLPPPPSGFFPPPDVPLGDGVPACRCYRCGKLCTVETVTVDRIVPGCVKTAKYPKGGTYRRENIRPACSTCNESTGGKLAHRNRKVKR